MSHINGVSPATLTVAPGQTVTLTVDATTAADEGFGLAFEASDGSKISVTALVDRPDAQVVIGGAGPIPAHQVRGTATGGVLAPVAGQPLKVTWTAPA